MAAGDTSSAVALAFLQGGGAMGAAIRAHPWGMTPLGPPTSWPQSLRSLVGLMLSSGQPMFMAWGEDRTWLYNDAFTPILGLKHPTALGAPSRQVWAEAWAVLEPMFDQVFAGDCVHMDDFGLELDRQGVLEEAHFAFSYNPARDESGAVAGLFGICTETTRQVMATRRLADERDQFAQLFEQAPTFMAILRASDYRIELANPGFMKLIGRRDVVGKTVAEALPEAVAQGYLQLLDTVRDTGEPFNATGSLFASQPVPGGPVTDRYLDFVYQPIRDATGAIVSIFVEGADVTDRKQAEAALQRLNETLEHQVAARTGELMAAEEALRQSQKMEAVGQLTGGIAHDFNNLLAGISGNLELLESRVSQGRIDAIPRYLDAAQSAAKRATTLTQRLLAFSRRQTLDPKPMVVNRLIGAMEELLRRSIGPDIEMEVVGAVGLWPTLVDPNQLENALLNLCINARDAMPGGGRLTIETANEWLDDKAAKDRDLAPGQYISICVADTGTGMTPEVIQRAFDPFFTTKPMGKGTGLGLSMIYGFVRQSGGQVRIDSKPGQGTSMCLYLPRFVGDAPSDDAVVSTAFSFDGSRGETVLVVDDEPTVRMLIVDVLQEAGYRVIEAGDGSEGLRILQAPGRIDLLITDVGLPGGINGRQVADAARVARPELKVLFITGFAENAVVANGHLDPGMQIITKPFAIEVLGNKIREMIDG